MTSRLLAPLTIAAALAAGAVAITTAAARSHGDAPPAPVVAAGPAQSCIPLAAIDHTRVRDDHTIDFYMHGRTVYRSVLPAPCPELGFEQRFGYETSLSQLCSTDIVTVLHDSPPLRGASCGLGAFQPITGAPRD